MIHDVAQSKATLSNFLMKKLDNNQKPIIPELNLPELIQMDGSPSSYLNSLNLEDTLISSVILPNLEQQIYYISGSNITNVNLTQIKAIETTNDISFNGLSNFPIKFLHNTKLQTLNLPNFQGARTNVPNANVTISNPEAAYAGFWNNYWLKDVSFGENIKSFNRDANSRFNGFWFNNNYSLLSLRLYYPFVLPANRVLSGFANTPIGNGNGYIYVPDEVVNDYKTAANWIDYASKIRKMSDYNPSNTSLGHDTITKSWAEIIDDCNSSTFDFTQYHIGDTKTITLENGIPIQFQLARVRGRNTDIDIDRNDILASNSTQAAALTWISKTISIFEPLTNLGVYSSETLAPRNYGNTTTTANLRAYLTTILNQFPDVLQAPTGIKTVKKYSYGYDTDTEQMKMIPSDERLWIPSVKELITQQPDDYNRDPDNQMRTYPSIFDIKMGETNIKTAEIVVRDFSGNNASYPDTIYYDSTKNKYYVHPAGATSAYVFFGFCT